MARHRPGLASLLFVGGASLLIIPALVAGTLYTGALQRSAEAGVVENLRFRGELSANQIARRLDRLWRQVEALSRLLDPAKVGDARERIDLLSDLDDRYSWIGIAEVGGRVLASTKGMLEGVSVAERPWFRRGLEGPAAIDVHEAVLLAKLLPATGETRNFIDFAAPLKGANGNVTGVVGAHLDWRWMVDTLTSLQSPGIDILLISRDRVVLFGPPDLVDRPLDVGSAIAASRAPLSARDERWPDGKDYFTLVVPAIAYSDLPSFGWSLLMRQSVDDALRPTRELVRTFWVMLGTGAFASLVLLFLGARWVATPLRRLAGSADALVSSGEPQVPRQETRYDEVNRLSAALVRLQFRAFPGRPEDGGK